MISVKEKISEPSPIIPSIGQVLEVMNYFAGRKNGKQKKWPVFYPEPETSPENIEADIRTYEILPAGEELLEMMATSLVNAIFEKVDTHWCCRRHHPMTNLFTTMCLLMETEPTDFLEANINENDYSNLELIVSFCENAPLKIMDASEPQAFASFLTGFPTSRHGLVVYCDWALDEEEESLVKRLAMEKKVRFAWPQQ